MEIGRINGYNKSTVDNIIKRHEIKKQRLEASSLFIHTKEDEETKRVVIPYVHQSNVQMSRLYRECDIQAVNRNENSVQKLIGSTKDKIPDLLKSGVYEIGCLNCDAAYYGKTERNPTIRYDEHDYCIIKNDCKSAVAKHMIQNNHATNISKVKLIQPISGRNTSAFECYEKIQIIQHRRLKELMNVNDGNIQSKLFDIV